MNHILMVAAENGTLPNGKVGGIGDVVRDIPIALARRDCKVSVITPAYGSFSKLPGAVHKQSLNIQFAGIQETVELYHLSQTSNQSNIMHYVLEHPQFSSCGAGKIYCDDPPERPFAKDATKFALFCIAVAEAIKTDAFGKLDVLHCHDWHAALLLVLRHYMPAYKTLKTLQCAYTIHNLSIQGTRPFKGDSSSLETWFPDLNYDSDLLGDPKWTDCINPMASAIRLADTVHAVSPTYAREILLPSDSNLGQYGGEGLEKDLVKANHEKRLFGILNGCEYSTPTNTATEKLGWTEVTQKMVDGLTLWVSRSSNLASAHFIAFNKLNALSKKRPKMLLTSVGRLTDQKVALMHQATSSGKPALHAALEKLGDYGMLLVIGTGDADCEQFLCETMVHYNNFIFLRGYSEALADVFYEQGDLFFMPSSFEPCGISQMLALRAGQLCLVHQVGGLNDTVIDNKTGYAFSGNNLIEQADALVETTQRAMKQHQKKSAKWQNMRRSAAAVRFEWDDIIDAYLKQLYKIY